MSDVALGETIAFRVLIKRVAEHPHPHWDLGAKLRLVAAIRQHIGADLALADIIEVDEPT